MQFHAQSIWRPRTVGIVLGAFIALILASPLHANGTHLGSQEVYSDDVGPYTLSVTTTPAVSLMHFSIYLSLKDTDFPVLGAELTVWAELGGNQPIALGPLAAPRVDTGPNWFAVDFPVDEPGEWTFTLQVDAPLAEETTTFTVFVRDSDGISITLVAIVATVIGVIGLWVGRRLKMKKRKSK